MNFCKIIQGENIFKKHLNPLRSGENAILLIVNWFRVFFQIFYKTSKIPNCFLLKLVLSKDLMQGKLFQRCAHLLYCSVLSLGGNVNTWRMSKPDMGSIFHIKKSMKYSSHYQNYQNLMLLTSSDTMRTLMHLFLFTNSAQRELVSICTQSIRNCN